MPKIQERSDQFLTSLVVDRHSLLAHQNIMLDAVIELYRIHINDAQVALYQTNLVTGRSVVTCHW